MIGPPIDRHHVEVSLCRAIAQDVSRVDPDLVHGEIRQRRIVEGEEMVVEGVPSSPTMGIEAPDHLFEGKLLVGQGAEGDLANLAEEVGDGHRRIDLEAHRSPC